MDRFYNINAIVMVESDGVQVAREISLLHKASYSQSTGIVVSIVEDSSSEGNIILSQPFKPWHIEEHEEYEDSEGNTMIRANIIEYNPRWDSAEEAFSYITKELGV